MIVLVAGMQRSGSTWSFNVVRELLLRHGTVYHEFGDDLLATLGRAGDADHVILKTHAADPFAIRLVRLGAARMICTVRDIADAMASWIETFDRSDDSTIQAFRGWLAMYRQVRPHALTLHYEQIDRNPNWTAWRLARHLTHERNPLPAVAIARRYAKARMKDVADAMQRDQAGVIDAGFTWYDTTTALHRRHVSSLVSRPAHERLPAERVERLVRAVAEEAAAVGLGHRAVS